MRLPSTTVASSTQSAPALTMSSRIAPTLVARRPTRIRAEIGTQPAWQMKAIGLPAPSNARTRSSTACERRSLSGANPPGMTRASKSPSATCSTVVSTGTGPWPFFPCTGWSLSPATVTSTSSSASRYSGYSSSMSSKSSAARMRTVR